jgi:hypothetical protein
MMHGYVVEGSPEKHRGSPEVPVIRDGRGISFSRGRAFQKGRRRLPVPLDWRESPPACSVSEREADDQTDCNFQHS